MKKLLLIFLLIPAIADAQIVINKLFFGFDNATTNASAIGVSNKTYTAGRLYLYMVATTGTTNPGTLSTTTTTWNTVISIGDATRRIQVFRLMPAATVSGETVNIGSFGSSMSGYALGVWEISGVKTSGSNGADAVVQAVDDNGAAEADPSITLASLAHPMGNAVIAFFWNDNNTFSGTAESGWDEDKDSGHADPTTGVYVTSRVRTNDNTVSVTAAASTWIGVAMEIQMGKKIHVIR